MATKHPGFKAVQQKIARREGVSMKQAGAILASASRHASPQAKKANPRLKRVKYRRKNMGCKKKGGKRKECLDLKLNITIINIYLSCDVL